MRQAILHGARLIDPTHVLNGQLVDIHVADTKVTRVAAHDRAVLGRMSPDVPQYDYSGTLVMAGGIDLHTHIGGGKLNLARLLTQDLVARASHAQRGPVWSSIETGLKYSQMGYTACFEPAMLLPQARATHLQLADTPLVDSGAYVVMGNEEWLLKALGSGLEQPVLEELVAWTVQASHALAVKVVNAGGISAFKFNQRSLDVDQAHALYGVTPRTVLRNLAAAVDAIGLAHPLHVHASNLGVPGNIRATLATLKAVEGHRIHLTHAQFNAYSDEGPMSMSSGALELSELVNRSPNVSLDVGQIVFGQTVTISADAPAQYRNRRHAQPSKAIISDVECTGGCGVVPMRYANTHYVSSLQWTIGLELLLLIKNPYQVLLTTDHPNGGPFTSYPHLIRLLMDRTFRQEALANIHPLAAERTLLKDLEREYSIDEIAIITRAAPARLLGLTERGQVRPDALADLVFYEPKADWEATFTRAKAVWKSGQLLPSFSCDSLSWDVALGVLSELPRSQSIRSVPRPGLKLAERWQEPIEETLGIPIGMLAISDDELQSRLFHDNRTGGTADNLSSPIARPGSEVSS